MADLDKAITTQEELDAVIKDRLGRQENKIRAEYADYDTLKASNEKLTGDLESANNNLKTAQEQVKTHEATISGLNAQVAQYERDSAKTKAALAAGLPAEMANRLQGDDAEALKADAEALAKMFTANRQVQPLADPESTGGSSDGNSERESLRKVLKNVRGEQ